MSLRGWSQASPNKRSGPSQALAALIRKHATDAEKVVFETGPLSVWFYHALTSQGLPAICSDARHAKAALDMASNNTDADDADGLTHLAEVGFYREVCVKDFDSMLSRILINARSKLFWIGIEISNQISGMLKVFGLASGVTATAVIAAAENPAKFKRSRSVGAWLGLTTRRYKSGEVDYDGHISRRGDAHLRGPLYDAAIGILIRARADSDLRTCGTRLRERIAFKLATVALPESLPSSCIPFLQSDELFDKVPVAT